MSNSKGKKGNVDKTAIKALHKVHGAAVTKPSQTPSAKSREIAHKVAKKEEKGLKKKKAPTPVSSESESESDVLEEDSASSSSSESDSEVEKSVKPKRNGVSQAVAVESESDSESESEAESDSGESEASEKEAEVKKLVARKPAAKNLGKEGDSSSSESESEQESGSDSSESEDEAPAKPTAKATAPSTNGVKKAREDVGEGSDRESDSESESASESESESVPEPEDESEEEEKEAPKKRKAEEKEQPSAKKPKTGASGEPSNSANLFVGNLSWNVDEEWLHQEFQSFGEIAAVRLITDRDSGRSRGYGYVEFTNAADAKSAYEAKKDTEMDGRKINLDYANPRPVDGGQANGGRDRAQARARSYGDQLSTESDTLFVGNIAFGAGQDDLRDLFQDKGSIMGVRLPTDPNSGRPKGYGYVQFSSVEEARQALTDLQGAELAGRPMRLDFSTPRSNDGGGNRGGRGDRGDRGGRGGRGDRGGRGGRGMGGIGRGGRGGRGGFGGRGGSTNRGGFGDFAGQRMTFD